MNPMRRICAGVLSVTLLLIAACVALVVTSRTDRAVASVAPIEATSTYDAAAHHLFATQSDGDRPGRESGTAIRRDSKSAGGFSAAQQVFVAAETGEGAAVDVGHAGIHQFPGATAGKSQFFDDENLGGFFNTDGFSGVLQKNGNTRFVMRGSQDVGVDRTTGLPTNVYTFIRKPDGSVLTMFPGTSPKS